MSIKLITIPPKRLGATIDGTAMLLKVNNILGWDGVALTPTILGDKLYASLQNATGTVLELMELDPATIASSSITILRRGLQFDGDRVTEVPANKLTWVKGVTIVNMGTDTPMLLSHFVRDADTQTIAGTKTFSSNVEIPLVPTNSNHATSKDYVDNVSVAGGPDASVTTKGVTRLTAASSVTLGNPTITIATPAVVTLNSHGLTANDSIVFTTTGALPTGIVAGTTYYVISTGLTANSFQFSGSLGGSAVNTSGAQSGTHTLARTTPRAMSETDTRNLTQDENNANAGTSGAPSSINPFVTQNDTTNKATKTATTISFTAPSTISDSGSGFVTAGFYIGQTITVTGSASNNGTYTITNVTAGVITVSQTSIVNEIAGASVTISAAFAGKVLRLDPSGNLPAVNGAALTGVALTSVTLTANEDISQNDSVYPTSNDTVKRLFPSAQGTGAAVTTAPTTSNGAIKTLPMSGGRYFHLIGGDGVTGGPLRCQIRTINAAETDFANGAEVVIQNTDGSTLFDIAEIDTDKFLIIYQKIVGGVADGIIAIACSVSGTVITFGAPVTVETVGALGSTNAVCKIDTDKALIIYQDDAGGDCYTKVLTTATLVITQNAAVLVKAMTGGLTGTSLAQLSTDLAVCTYADGGGGTAGLFSKVITVTGTVPALGSEQTLVATNTNYTTGLRSISATKTLLCYSSASGGAINDQCAILTISGNTVTKSTDLAINANQNTLTYFGMYVISTRYALVAKYSTNTNIILYLLQIDGALPVSLGTQNLTSGDTTGVYNDVAIVKVLPWTYHITGSLSNSDYIVKLTPVSTAQIGVAASAISNAASGSVHYRYQSVNNFTGLTAGTIYYIDDTGQPTAVYSLTAPRLGVGINTTKMFLN